MAHSTHITLPEELFEVSGSSTFTGSLELARLEAGPDSYRFEAPLPWNVLIVNTGEGSLLVSGSITGAGTTACARCLDDFAWDFEGEVEGCILLADPWDQPPEDLDEDEYVIIGPDRDVELKDFLVPALLLDAPLTPLCQHDCAGLCPSCGKNLNEGPCECREEEDDSFAGPANPFAALKDYSFEN